MTVDKEAIFNKEARQGMIEFNLTSFKTNYAHLYRVILSSMDEYAASLLKERDELKRKISTYHDALIERDEYFEIIKELVELKMMKDSIGKTDNYLLRQPLAWRAAFDAIQEKL